MIYRQQQERNRRQAFTLMEMLIVVAIIVAVAGIGGFFIFDQYKGSQMDTAELRAKNLEKACETYKLRNGDYPQSLAKLLEYDNNKLRYVDNEDQLKDPWGQPYQYDNPGQKNQGRIDISTTYNGLKLGNFPRGK
jgi:general secretion pathway protein G